MSVVVDSLAADTKTVVPSKYHTRLCIAVRRSRNAPAGTSLKFPENDPATAAEQRTGTPCATPKASSASRTPSARAVRE